MEEHKEGTKTFTEKEVMDIIDKMHKDYGKAMSEVNNTLTRLNVLFKVIEFKDVFSKEFIEKCASEIEAIVTIPDNTEE